MRIQYLDLCLIAVSPPEQKQQTTLFRRGPQPGGSAWRSISSSCSGPRVGAAPLNLLFSDSEGVDGMKQIHVSNNGSSSQNARVDVQGVPADGIVDTAADITIMGGKLFPLVAAATKLRKRKPEKVPRS